MTVFSKPRIPVDWIELDTILLDMDGTLLDRHFDDYFWETYVPDIFASKHGMSLSEAKERLLDMYRAREKTLDWTDLDFWSDSLGLDIPSLKLRVQHLIQVHPFVLAFLSFCRTRGKKIYLVTNAHSKTLQIKMQKTAIGNYFDRVVCSQEIGCPKEHTVFWEYLRKVIHYEPERTLLADDTEAVLVSAKRMGIRWLIFVARPSSSLPPSFSSNFPSILYFKDLMP